MGREGGRIEWSGVGGGSKLGEVVLLLWRDYWVCCCAGMT